MAAASNRWEYPSFWTHHELSDALHVLGRFCSIGPLNGWRKCYEEWDPDGDWVYYDFDLHVSYGVYLEGKGILGSMAINWQDAQGTRGPTNVEYRYVFTVTLRQLAQGGSEIGGSFHEEIDRYGRCFNHESFSVPSMAGNIGDPFAALRQWMAS